ncbi:MAG: hypothetical protein HYV04_10860 [Deltaproteobacteria bacterium]|nr:hypothetical protein [Deltaproteobacteria bacterium]
MESGPPRHAATVIVLRPDRHGHFEVFLTRRPHDMEFLGGYYVFPGGVVEKDDESPQMLRRCYGLSPRVAQRVVGARLSPKLAMAHWVAGIRELFEEVGILLCVTETGEPVDMKNEERKSRLYRKRKALVAGAISFAELLESEGLFCDTGTPVYFSHRITPQERPVRFDTCFFLTPMPIDQTPLLASEEVAETRWLTPERALEEFRRGRLPLVPPTLAALETLSDFDSWRSLSAVVHSGVYRR